MGSPSYMAISRIISPCKVIVSGADLLGIYQKIGLKRLPSVWRLPWFPSASVRRHRLFLMPELQMRQPENHMNWIQEVSQKQKKETQVGVHTANAFGRMKRFLTEVLIQMSKYLVRLLGKRPLSTGAQCICTMCLGSTMICTPSLK